MGEQEARASTHTVIANATEFLQRLESRIQKPFATIDDQRIRGFRFASPTVVHYVVLNVARSISLLNAMILLRDSGFKSEFAMLARALLENTNKLQYVVGGLTPTGMDRKTSNFLREFFDDNTRDITKRSRFRPISQKDINRRNSERTSRDIEFNRKFGLPVRVENEDGKLEKLISGLYNEYSNHVHGRYPEMMDIFGEFSTGLKLNGNLESEDLDEGTEVEFLELLATGVQQSLRTSLLSLQLCGAIRLDQTELKFCVGDTFLR